jgi:hypothetical protein
MIWVGLAGGVFLIVLLARLFGAASREADRPTFVIEKPPLPRKLAPVAEALDRWREEGRLTREEYEHGTALLREDAAKDTPRP